MVVLSSITKQVEQAMIKLHPSMAPAARFLPFVGSFPPPQLPSWSWGVIIAIVTLTKTLTYSLIYLLLSIFKILIIFVSVCTRLMGKACYMCGYQRATCGSWSLLPPHMPSMIQLRLLSLSASVLPAKQSHWAISFFKKKFVFLCTL